MTVICGWLPPRLIYVDFATQQRILKDSAHWYREVIASNGANL